MAQDKVNLGTGADTPGADTLFAGFTKLNNNMDLLASTANGAGASLIGYEGGTTVQAAIDGISYPTNGNTIGENASTGTGAGLIYINKVADALQFRKILAGTNVEVEVIGEDIEIRSTASASNTAEVVKHTRSTATSYDLAANDEIVLVDTEGTGEVTINLTNAANKRIVLIKNLMKSGYSHEVTIAADTGDNVEDDRTGLPGLTTAIGPGSAMRLVYWAADTTWSIV